MNGVQKGFGAVMAVAGAAGTLIGLAMYRDGAVGAVQVLIAGVAVGVLGVLLLRAGRAAPPHAGRSVPRRGPRRVPPPRRRGRDGWVGSTPYAPSGAVGADHGNQEYGSDDDRSGRSGGDAGGSGGDPTGSGGGPSGGDPGSSSSGGGWWSGGGWSGGGDSGGGWSGGGGDGGGGGGSF